MWAVSGSQPRLHPAASRTGPYSTRREERQPRLTRLGTINRDLRIATALSERVLELVAGVRRREYVRQGSGDNLWGTGFRGRQRDEGSTGRYYT